jgi:hypothetical protein
LEYFFERAAKTQLAITAPYTQLAPTLKTPYRFRILDMKSHL